MRPTPSLMRKISSTIPSKKSRSWETMMLTPLKCESIDFIIFLLGISKWFVGSSSRSNCGFCKMRIARATLLRSHPESALIFSNGLSPMMSRFPSSPRMVFSVSCVRNCTSSNTVLSGLSSSLICEK